MGGTFGSRTTTILVWCAAAAMLVLPAFNAFTGEMSRFGWQMYARASTFPEFRATYSDGSVRGIPVHRLVTHARGEVDYAAVLPGFICGRDPEVVAVHVERATPPLERTVPCAG